MWWPRSFARSVAGGLRGRRQVECGLRRARKRADGANGLAGKGVMSPASVPVAPSARLRGPGRAACWGPGWAGGRGGLGAGVGWAGPRRREGTRAARAETPADALRYGAPGTPLAAPSPGRLAQRESASFTPRRSLVRSQYRPPGQLHIETARVSGRSRAGRFPGAWRSTTTAVAPADTVRRHRPRKRSTR